MVNTTREEADGTDPKRQPGPTRPRLVDDEPPDRLVGRKIVAVRPMTRAEMDRERWPYYPHTVPVCLEFDDGTVIFPGRDTYGESGPGFLLGVEANRHRRQFVFRTVEGNDNGSTS